MAVAEAEIAREVARLAKEAGWAARQGSISLIREETAFHAYPFGDMLFFMAKPVLWDRIFWQIMEIQFTRNPGPSRHWWGMSCPAPKRATADRKGKRATDMAWQILDFAETQVIALAGRDLSAMPRRFLQGDRADHFTMTETVILLAEGKCNAARGLSEDVVNGRRKARILSRGSDGRSFFERVLDRPCEVVA